MRGIEHLTGFAPVRAKGSKHVTGVVVARDGDERTFGCDLLVVSGRSAGRPRLPLAGRRQHPLRPRTGRYVPGRVPDGVRVVGELPAPRRPAAPCPPRRRTRGASSSSATARTSPPRTSTCRVSEGFASLELSKRYTTVTMGPCQGRMCHRNSGLVIADELGVDPDEQRVGVTTARPPHNPTSFSLLAARGYEPEKRTAIAPLARGAWRQDAVGRRLEAALRLRRRRRRDRSGARVARPDRRLDAGQDDRARARRRRVPRADLPEPLRRHEAGPRPLRHRLRRRRVDPRRRHRGPAVRGPSTT